MTFSIAAYDPDEKACGVAVASKFLAVGAVVSWAKAGAGAVATQSYANVNFGPDGLALMGMGVRADDALAWLIRRDTNAAVRQVGIVDTHGGAAAHTGSGCHAWAGHVVGEGFTCQGNLLAGEKVVQAMAEAYRAARGELADRLYAALLAGDQAGGDKRGRQGAALLVVKPNGGYGGDNDRYLDLRVDDDPHATEKLAGILQAHHLFFGTAREEDRLPITEEIARELQAMLRAGGYTTAEPNGQWDDASQAAFAELVGNENLEERWSRADGNFIDRVALEYLRARLTP
jgi:uncharacterized Ntn-hydrolase superfamily protein